MLIFIIIFAMLLAVTYCTYVDMMIKYTSIVFFSAKILIQCTNENVIVVVQEHLSGLVKWNSGAYQTV